MKKTVGTRIPTLETRSGFAPYRGGSPRRRALAAVLRTVAVLAVAAVVAIGGFLFGGYLRMGRNQVPIVKTTPTPTVDATPGENTPDATPTLADKSGLERDLRTPIVFVEPKDPDVENILLIGVDRRNTESINGNSDTMMIVSVDRKNGTMKLLSLLRDIYVDIENGGKTVKGKINASYAYGGPGLVVNTINRTFDLDIQKYVLIDFKSAVDVVDQAGGLDLTINPEEIANLNQSVREENNVIFAGTEPSAQLTQSGLQHLDGRQVLAYARIRKVDLVSNGKTYAMDFGRVERQKIVIRGLMKKFFDINLIEKIGMLNTGFDMIETNLKLSDAYSLMTFASNELTKDASSSGIQGYSIPKWGSYTVVESPVWCFVVDFDKAIPEIQNFIWGRTFAFDHRDPVSP